MALPHDSATTPNLPQADTSSNTWDPSTISNVIFSTIMVFIGLIAIWQAHQAHRRSSRALDREFELPESLVAMLT
jgi:prolipoprotein diacylglyceryltransferase